MRTQPERRRGNDEQLRAAVAAPRARSASLLLLPCRLSWPKLVWKDPRKVLPPSLGTKLTWTADPSASAVRVPTIWTLTSSTFAELTLELQLEPPIGRP